MRRLLRWALVLIAIGALIGGGLVTAVCLSAGGDFVAEPSDCIIVLGARVWPYGELSNALLYRCQAALSFWREGKSPAIIVCGGQGPNEPVTEARAMFEFLTENGVPAAAVFLDETSVNTKENLKNAHAIMEAQGFRTAAVCTNDYHLTRAMWLARDEGLSACGLSAPSPRQPLSLIRNRLREACSWVLYFVRKALGR